MSTDQVWSPEGITCMRCKVVGHTWSECTDPAKTCCMKCWTVGVHNGIKCTKPPDLVNKASVKEQGGMCLICSTIGHWSHACPVVASYELSTGNCATCGGKHRSEACPKNNRTPPVLSKVTKFFATIAKDPKILSAIIESGNMQAYIDANSAVTSMQNDASNKRSRD